MRWSRLIPAGLLAGLTALGSAPERTSAQTLPVELVLIPSEPGSALARRSDAPALTPPPLPATFQPVEATTVQTLPSTRPVSVEASPTQNSRVQNSPVAEPDAPVATASGSRAGAPEPARAASPAPIRKPTEQSLASLRPPAVTEPARSALGTSAAPSTAPAIRQERLTDAEIVARANAYFTNLKTLVANFTQVGGDGRRIGGTLYLQRPGKVRFEYDKPSTLEVVADGSSVAVRDTKLATQDLYSISQTPLKFLLRERVDLGQDIKISGIATENAGVRMSLEDRSTLGGVSRITLYFDPQVESLNQWRIVDPQGFQTVVILHDAERGQNVDQSLFVINYDRAIPTDAMSR